MPINVFDLVSDRKTVTLEFPGGPLTVTYRPNQLTPARELAIIRAAGSGLTNEDDDDEDQDNEQLERAKSSIERQLSMFCEVVESWDFMGPLARSKEGDRFDLPRELNGATTEEVEAYCQLHGATLVVPPGVMVPIQFDPLTLIGSNFLMTVVTKINEDMSPGPKRKRR